MPDAHLRFCAVRQSGTVEKEEAIAFWKKNFAKVNADAMFNEVDDDNNGSLTHAEFMSFWANCKTWICQTILLMILFSDLEALKKKDKKLKRRKNENN